MRSLLCTRTLRVLLIATISTSVSAQIGFCGLGSYSGADFCQPCEVDHYCDGKAKSACPLGLSTRGQTRASSIEDCHCPLGEVLQYNRGTVTVAEVVVEELWDPSVNYLQSFWISHQNRM
jgi:hypothetical protein